MKKKLIRGISLLAASLFIFAVPVMAGAEKNISLESQGNKAETCIEIPDETKEEVRALQLGFKVTATKGSIQKDQITFVFDQGITSKVKEYRYHEDTGILNIYISGKQNLFANEKLKIGSVVLGGENTTAEISVLPESFQIVNAALDMQTESVNAPAVVEIFTEEQENSGEDQGDKENEGDKEDQEDKEDKEEGGNLTDPKDPPEKEQEQSGTNEENATAAKGEKVENKETLKGVETGDTSNIAVYILLLLSASGVLAAVKVRRKKTK